MNILMIDTSGPSCGVAVAKDGKICYEAQNVSGKTHSQRVMPMVDTALAMSETTLSEIDVIGAVVGPGSFTGVRIGVSTAKALAHAAGKSCVAVDALHALAANAVDFHGVICPILDARAGQVYGAVFSADAEGGVPERLTEDCCEKLDVFLDTVELFEGDALFLGDGVPVLREKIRERMGERAHFAPMQHVGLRAGSACQVAEARLASGEEPLDYIHLLPLYLRAPQAERERAAKEAAKKKDAEESNG